MVVVCTVCGYRVGNQSVPAPPAAGRQNGGQEADQGGEARQGRAPPHQHRLDVDWRARVERQGGPGQDPTDVTRLHGDRGESRAIAQDREALAVSR